MPESYLSVKIAAENETRTASEDLFIESVSTTTTPRSLIIIPRCKSQAACRRVTPTSISDIIEKRLPNGDLYIGTFSNKTTHGSGKHGNNNSNSSIVMCEDVSSSCFTTHKLSTPLMVVSEKGMNIVMGEKGTIDRNFPRICIWESDGEAGDITCNVLDAMEASMLFNDRDAIKLFRKNPTFSIGGETKKSGQIICKEHKDYDLMLDLQLGIRCSAGKHASISRDLRPADFDPKEKFWTKFPAEGSKLTPPHQSMDFRWKDYCPVVFRRLRELFQVDPSDYMLAICGSDALKELSSPGKSGSSFYLTQDDRFMIKTVKKSEVKVLIKMLPSYYEHMSRYENSLVTKFYGVHCIKRVGGTKTRFIIMGNLFCSEYKIHRRFDLKGSSHGRRAGLPDTVIDETTTLKDLDLNYAFRLQSSWYNEMIKQIDRDCKFLETEGIMDYSLLVGLHFCDLSSGDKIKLSPFLMRGGKHDSCQKLMLQDRDRFLAGRKPLMRLGANMPARVEQLVRRSMTGHNHPYTNKAETNEAVLYLGIIDILQDYDISKKLEHAYKSLQFDPTSISAVDPKLYSKRFRDFIGTIFVEDR